MVGDFLSRGVNGVSLLILANHGVIGRKNHITRNTGKQVYKLAIFALICGWFGFDFYTLFFLPCEL